MTKETRKDFVGTELFQQFYRTGDISKLFAGYREYMAVNSTGFIDRLRSASGGHYLSNEFAGVEYELKFNVIVGEKPAVSMTPIALAQSVRRTFNGMRKYLADGVLPGSFTDVHYFGDDIERLLLEEGPPQIIKQKTDLAFKVNMPQIALLSKRKETTRNTAGIEDILRSVMLVASKGAQYHGRAAKGKVDVDVLDTRSGRVYTITSSETTANQRRLYQVEVEYKGFIGGFKGERDVSGKYESEEQIVEGIYDIGMHVRRRIMRDKPWSFLLEATNLTKYDFVKQVQANRNAKLDAMHLDAMGFNGIFPVKKKVVV